MIRARTLITESLRGNRGQGHVPGQLACMVAWAACESMEGNVQKAMTLAAFVESYLSTGSYPWMEPDRIALSRILADGKDKLTAEIMEQSFIDGRALRMEDILAQEFPSIV
jgi:hypothetical protein